MPTITRRDAKLFRAVLRHTVLVQEPRNEWPLMQLQTGEEGTRFHAAKGRVAVLYDQPGEKPAGSILLRSSILGELEGNKDDPVTLEKIDAAKARATWHDEQVPRSVEFDLPEKKRASQLPPLPKQWTSLSLRFASAWNDALACTASSNGRYGFSQIQLRGKQGQVVATDGRQLLIRGGFAFPWSEEYAVPALTVFRRQKLLPQGTLEIGKTDSHIGLRINPWTFLLDIKNQASFPDVDRVIPISKDKQRWQIHPDDIRFLMQTIPKLAAKEEEFSSITLELRRNTSAWVRTAADSITSVELPRSPFHGKNMRVRMNRIYLLRALQLGFDKLEIIGSDKPIQACNDRDIFVWVPLGCAEPLPKKVQVTRISAIGQVTAQPIQPQTERTRTMPTNAKNGQATNNKPDSNGLEDLISQADELRNLLQEIGSRLSRHIAALKQHRKHSRVVRQAVASIRQLELGE